MTFTATGVFDQYKYNMAQGDVNQRRRVGYDGQSRTVSFVRREETEGSVKGQTTIAYLRLAYTAPYDQGDIQYRKLQGPDYTYQDC